MWSHFNALIRGNADDASPRGNEASRQMPGSGSAARLPVASSLDVIGQRDEALRQRIGEMQERLDELKALSGDFSAIITPIGDIAAELPRATARIIELEGGLAQARQAITELRLENVAFADRTEALSRDLAIAQARADSTARELGAHQWT